MRTFVFTAIAGLLTLSSSAFAAHPSTIRFDQNGKTADGTQFSRFVVQCSNGESKAMTAWNDQRKWCVGDQSQKSCFRRQLRAAQAACRR